MASRRSASIASAMVDCGRDAQVPSRVGDAHSPRSRHVSVAAGTPTSMFLSAAELVFLTGRHRKAKQIQQLRTMGVPFYVNASGHAVVARAVLTGGRSEPHQSRWIPAVAKL